MFLSHFGYGKYGPARRGKRLRPHMLMRVATGEGAALEDCLDAAVAVEIFHNYSLVHDDIEDGDELRRGRPTLWAAYGVPQAINGGDAMCALSFLALARAQQHIDAERILQMLAILHEAHAIMCEGQSLDLFFETEKLVEPGSYRHMIGAKTAQLFEASCRLGAHAARCGNETIDRYGALGRAYGLAFQIRDDVHGIWSSSGDTGKRAGNDIARRKWTFPVVWAIAQPASPARDAVAQAYALGRSLEPSEVDVVIAALDRLGAREAAQAALAEHLAVVEQQADARLGDFLLKTLAAGARVTELLRS